MREKKKVDKSNKIERERENGEILFVNQIN